MTSESLDIDVSLPDDVSEPSDEPGDYTFFIYGPIKIGKTSFCAQFPGAFFMMCEPGARALRVYQREVKNWLEFIKYGQLLEADERFENIIVDTIDMASNMAFEYACNKLAIDDPGDQNDWGTSWRKVGKEFMLPMQKLSKVGKGIIFISHSKLIHIGSRNAGYDKIVPTCGGKASDLMDAVCDVVGYYAYHGKERRLWIRGNEFVHAGCRLEEHFLTSSGEQIVSIPMGNSAQESYENFLTAFYNEQKDVGDYEIPIG